MTTLLHTFHTALKETPWRWLDIARGYDYGWIIGYSLGSSSKKSDINIVKSAAFILQIYLLAREKSLDQRVVFWKSRVTYVALPVIAAAATYLIYKNCIEKTPDINNIAGGEYLSYLPPTLATLNIAQIGITAREKPHRALVAGISGFISLLDAKKYLPHIASRVWSIAPWISDGIILYDGNATQRLLVIFTNIEKFFQDPTANS